MVEFDFKLVSEYTKLSMARRAARLAVRFPDGVKFPHVDASTDFCCISFSLGEEVALFSEDDGIVRAERYNDTDSWSLGGWLIHSLLSELELQARLLVKQGELFQHCCDLVRGRLLSCKTSGRNDFVFGNGFVIESHLINAVARELLEAGKVRVSCIFDDVYKPKYELIPVRGGG